MTKKITVALAGNPNSGKTSVFNALTGASQHTGNYPGVTVEKKQYFTKVFDIRAVWPPVYRVGPRNMELLEPVT